MADITSGTDKQIAYAEKVRENLLYSIDRQVQMRRDDLAARADAGRELPQGIVDKLAAYEAARAIVANAHHARAILAGADGYGIGESVQRIVGFTAEYEGTGTYKAAIATVPANVAALR